MRNIPIKQDDVGDTLPAAQYNSSQEELENIVTSAGMTLDDATGPDTSLEMLAQAVAVYASGIGVYQDDSLTRNDMVLNVSSGLRPLPATGYIDNQRVEFRKSLLANDGAATCNVCSKGVKPILNTAQSALSGGEITQYVYHTLVFRQAWDAFELVPQATLSPTNTVHVLYRQPHDVDGGAVTANQWNLRHMTDIDVNDGTIASLDSNFLTLEGGVYDFWLTMSSWRVGYTAVRIWNQSTSTSLWERTMTYSRDQGVNQHCVEGRFSLPSTQILSIEWYPTLNEGGSSRCEGEAQNIESLEETYLSWLLVRRNNL